MRFTRFIFPVCLSLALWTFSAGAQQFSEVSIAAQVDESGDSFGCGWIDYNNDGLPDLYVSKGYNGGSSDRRNHLYPNQGGTFGHDSGGGVEDTGDGRGIAWADFDDNGVPDLYLVNWGSENRLWVDDTPGYGEEGSTLDVDDVGNGLAPCWFDIEGDGDLDLFVTNSGSANRLYLNEPGQPFTEVAAARGVDDPTSLSAGVAACDYDGDGDVDLYVGNFGAPNRLYQNDGTGQFTDVANAAGVDLASDTTGVAWGDYDGDGDFDLYVCVAGTTNNANRLYRNDGGIFVDVAVAMGADGSSDSQGVAWWDYDNDGDLDLYVCNGGVSSAIVDNVFRNDGASFSDQTVAFGANVNAGSIAAATADYDGDGDLDIYVTGQGARFYQNDSAATGQDWIQIKLVGSISTPNLTPFGATVRIRAGGVDQYRQLVSSSGFLAQDWDVLHFGLGSSVSEIAELEIHWPSGATQYVAGLASGQQHVITEADTGLPSNLIEADLAVDRSDLILRSQTTSGAIFTAGGADTINLYGGPGSLEGRFQTLPDGTGPGDPQGWVAIGTVPLPESEAYGHLVDGSDVLWRSCVGAVNTSPMWAFWDDGVVVPGTGGTPCTAWCYALGGYVVNYNGGLSAADGIGSAIESPAIDVTVNSWPEPTAPSGAFLEFDVWRHLPLQNGIGYWWQLRSSSDGGSTWGPWRSDGMLYTGGRIGQWHHARHEVGEFFPFGTTHVQLRLGVQDVAYLHGLSGNDATPSPFFDNVSISRYLADGPLISVRQEDLFQDAFPQSGATDASTQALRSQMNIRIDTPAGGSGDSLVAVISSLTTDGEISDPATQIRLVYSLSKNPAFEDAIRGNAPTTTLMGGHMEWDEHAGFAVPGYISGTPLHWEVSFDLPDDDFMYPGDVLQYYIEAVDDLGRTSTLPEDISAFDDRPLKGPDPCVPGMGKPFSFDRNFILRGAPVMWEVCCDPEEPTCQGDPGILVVSAGGLGPLQILQLSLYQLGLYESAAYDVFHVRGHGQRLGNGIGSAGTHGATVAQLDRYHTILYLTGDNETSISDGSGAGLNDLSDDLGLLSSWLDSTGERSLVLMGDNVASALAQSGAAGSAWLSTGLGVASTNPDVEGDIGGYRAVLIHPTGSAPGFSNEIALLEPCRTARSYDRLTPDVGALSTHGFVDYGGSLIPGPAAGVLYDRMSGSDRKRTLVIPFDIAAVGDDIDDPGIDSRRTAWVGEILTVLGSPGAAQTPVETPIAKGVLELYAPAPTPFNPRTTIEYVAPSRGHLSIRVYDVRGRRVATLWDAEAAAGKGRVVWNGTDDDGGRLSSGVYFIHARGFGSTLVQRAVLVK